MLIPQGDKALLLATIFLPPLVAAVLAVITRGSTRQTIRALSVCGLIALLVGLALYDYTTKARSLRYVGSGLGPLHFYLGSRLALECARWLLITALAIALWDAASRRRWGWAAVLVAALLATPGVFAAFSGLPINDLFGGVLTLGGFQYPSAGHNFSASAVRLYFIIVEILMALASLPALLYAIRSGGSVSEEALAATIPDR